MTTATPHTITAMLQGIRPASYAAFSNAMLAANLAPTASYEPKGGGFIAVVLLPTEGADKLDALTRWLDVLTGSVDMTVGRRNATDDTVHLNVRAIDQGGAIIVTAQFSEINEHDAVRTIYERIERATPAELVSELVRVAEGSH